MGATRPLTSGRRYGVLVWRESAAAGIAPTELHIPASFAAASTVVVSDLGTTAGVPASGAISRVAEIGSTTAQKLVLASAGNAAGTVHVALILDGAGLSPTAAQLAQATQELIGWQSSQLP